jgi:DNA (cytosine-5)-methyltransferase 1
MQILDLFCGCGGLSLGFQKAGYEIVGAFDSWKPAIETYNANMDHKAVFCDLSDVQGFLKLVETKSFDMIMGGPPCQDFSSAGHRQEKDRANLTRSFAQIVAGAKPLIFLMENVTRSKTSNAYKEARNIFSEAGYNLTEIVLDASYCGVPQIRKRFFSIGILYQYDDFMTEIINSSLNKKRMTVRDYFGNDINVEHYYRHPRNYNRRAVFSIDEPSATIRGVSRPIPNGYKGHSLDSSEIGNNLRPLTTLERSRIQTFPKNFKWVGNKTDVEQMIGNAVPVNLAKFVAECLNKYVRDKFKHNKMVA